MTATSPVSEPPVVFLMTNSFETGGSEIQFATLVQALEENGCRAHIGCLATRGSLPDGFDRVQEFPVGTSLYSVRSLQTRLRLARYLRKNRVAVAHAFDFYTNLVLIPAAKLARVPVVIGSHRQLGDLLGPTKFRAQLAMLRWCDRVVCNSQAAATRLIDRGLPKDKIAIVANGLDPAAFMPVAPALARHPSVMRVGMIARMNTRSKNHRDFLIAAARLSHSLPHAEFVLAGDGPLRQELQQQARDLGIGDRVQFLGERRDIGAVLASVDVSVLPSFSESLSNAILESMAAGVPVVAADVGGNPELITSERGILVPAGNPDALTVAIERLLRNPVLRIELGQNAKRFAQTNFTRAAMAKRYEDLYADLIERKMRLSPRRKYVPPNRAARPLRVAIVAASSRYVGGQSVQAELLLEHWRNDPEVAAFFIPIDPRFPAYLKWVETIPFLRTVVRQPFYLSSLWRGMGRADIVHIFSASYWSFLIAPAPAWLFARLLRKKTMIHYHSGEARDHLRRFRSARPVLSRSDSLVVPTAYLADVFRAYGLDAQVVPNIVDPSQFSFRLRRPLRPHLVCTRGFHPYYRVDQVVRAFAEVQQEFPLAQLDLVGQGPEEKRIRELVARLNLERVNLIGVVTRQEIGRVYDAADIFVNASVVDNMPVSILEAFAAGLPVVSTAPEGIRYFVEHERTALLSEPNDAQALARNVIRLLREVDLGSHIALNAHEQSKRYQWSAVREQWLEIYRSLECRGRAAAQGVLSASETFSRPTIASDPSGTKRTLHG